MKIPTQALKCNRVLCDCNFHSATHPQKLTKHRVIDKIKSLMYVYDHFRYSFRYSFNYVVLVK